MMSNISLLNMYFISKCNVISFSMKFKYGSLNVCKPSVILQSGQEIEIPKKRVFKNWKICVCPLLQQQHFLLIFENKFCLRERNTISSALFYSNLFNIYFIILKAVECEFMMIVCNFRLTIKNGQPIPGSPTALSCREESS